MYKRIKTLMALLLLMAVTASAQLQIHPVAGYRDIVKGASEEVTENWWGYFDGDYSSISVTGIGSSLTLPLNYSCAIRVQAGNPEVLGKRIKAVKFAFERLKFIENVKVWMSEKLPNRPEDADVCCISLDKSEVKSFEKDDDVNIVNFTEPYQVHNKDVYIGYSFTVTSYEEDACTYPIVVSYSNTLENAFLLNWGARWRDLEGETYGNLAVMIMLDDGGDFEIGDANYDLAINVLDITYTLEYILKGSVSPFNKKGADIDGNGEINIVDVESIIDMILERYKAPANKNAADSNDKVVAEENENGVGVSLLADNSYRGFQMDVVLPEGCEITSLEAEKNVSATHDVRYTKISDGRYRIVANSINGSELASGDCRLFNICADTEDFKIENIVFATSELQEKRFADIRMQNVSGIEGVNGEEGNADVYNIYGIKAGSSMKNLAKGVYIVDGRKVVIK